MSENEKDMSEELSASIHLGMLFGFCILWALFMFLVMSLWTALAWTLAGVFGVIGIGMLYAHRCAVADRNRE